MKRISTCLIAVLLLIAVIINNIDNAKVCAMSNSDVGISSAKSYIVMDENGKVLVENNCDERREVASICKLMTSLITIDNIEEGNISLDDKFLASDYACAVEGSQAFLDAGCQYSVRDLLKSVIVASANDSAIVLAENIAGSESNFVKLMNAKAKEIGMENTLYANSTGLDDIKSQYSTARDTAIILNKISDSNIYKEDCKIWMDTLTHPSGRKTELVNTNRLVKYYPYCLTGKTGFTDEAGYCLSSLSKKDDLKLTCVVLGGKSSADRFSDSIALYNYAYANFESKKVVSTDDIIDNVVAIKGGKEEYLPLKYASDFTVTVKRGNGEVCEININVPDCMSAPIEIDSVVGEAIITMDGEIVGSVDILASKTIEHASYKDIIGKIFREFSTL